MSGADQIRAGDILLTRGPEFVSWAICAFDDSEASHAALALGDEIIAECVGSGLRTVTIAKALEGRDPAIVRHLPAGPDADAGIDPAPVVAVARRYLEDGASYAHQQIVLLGVLALTRRIPLPAGARRMVRAILDQAAAALNAMGERSQRPMTCSEFAYRCHTGARPADPYALRIERAAGADGETLLDWAAAHPDLPAAVPAGPAAVDRTVQDAECVLAPLISAYATATGVLTHAAPLPATLPAPTDLTDPSDTELLGAITGFGAALQRATAKTGTRGDAGTVTPEQALERIRTLAADPDFVTPGDLLRTPSLTERLRIDQGAKTPAMASAGNTLTGAAHQR